MLAAGLEVVRGRAELRGERAECLLGRPSLARFPAWLVDRDGRFVWLNAAANALVGDVRGKSYASIVDPAYLSLAREQFTRKLLGKRVTDYEIVLVTKDGSRAPIEVSSVRVD